MRPINDDGMEIPSPSQEKVKVSIMRLKNNKAAGSDGLPAELLKTGCNELVGRMHRLIFKIWLEESMYNDWNLSFLYSVLKKRDSKLCANYRGLSHIFSLSHIRFLQAYYVNVEILIGPYQCGFRPNKSTIHQIFTLCQILSAHTIF